MYFKSYEWDKHILYSVQIFSFVGIPFKLMMRLNFFSYEIWVKLNYYYLLKSRNEIYHRKGSILKKVRFFQTLHWTQMLCCFQMMLSIFKFLCFSWNSYLKELSYKTRFKTEQNYAKLCIFWAQSFTSIVNLNIKLLMKHFLKFYS